MTDEQLIRALGMVSALSSSFSRPDGWTLTEHAEACTARIREFVKGNEAFGGLRASLADFARTSDATSEHPQQPAACFAQSAEG